MPDPSETFIKEIAGQLPLKAAYKDLLSPAAGEAGQLLAEIIKTLRLALFPIQVAAAFQDRVKIFVANAVGRIPEERRVAPAPQILGPIIEGIRYEPEGTPIDAMFSELLSRSMDSERVNEAHPAYPLIIKQLSSDEARILTSLRGNTFDFVWTRKFDRIQNLFIGELNVEVDALPRDKIHFSSNIQFYMSHLDKLGLAGVFQTGNQEPLYSDQPGVQTGIRVRSQYMLTDFGERFVAACIGGGGDIEAAS